MTTEDDLQAMLDANPADHMTRLILADFLQDRDDPRAEGYRALGVSETWPTHYHGDTPPPSGFDLEGHFPAWKEGRTDARDELPRDWFYEMERVGDSHWSGSIHCGPTRRAIEDAAALAFAKLPAERRAELLQPATVTA